MFKLFDRNKAPKKPLESPFNTESDFIVKRSLEIIEGWKLKVSSLEKRRYEQDCEIIALKAIVSNLRKQKVYAGQRFYNPKDHKAPVVYLCARWNDWYMIRPQNEATPDIIRAEDWQKEYGHYELMPKPNTNLKNLR